MDKSSRPRQPFFYKEDPMKKLLIATGLLLFSSHSFAGAGVDGALTLARGGDDCFMKAFMAAHPTDEQTAKAHAIAADIKKIADENKPAMEDAAKAFMSVMMQHPIPRDSAHAARTALNSSVQPVTDAAFDGVISTINLLDADQRQLFNHAMYDCMSN
jgi:hypothetical protein